MPQSADLIGSLEASTILDVDRATVNRLALRGDITPALICPGYKGSNLFCRADVEALAKKRAA